MPNYNTCPICNKEFIPNPKKRSQTYCSRACFFESRKRQVEIICPTCGKTFATYQAEAKRIKHCSFECRRNQVIKNCLVCGTEFAIRASSAKKRFTCSRQCGYQWRIITDTHPKKGKSLTPIARKKVSDGLQAYYANNPQGHWNYQGIGTNERRGNHSAWQNARKATRERDNYKCQVCGITEIEIGRQLCVHHINPFRNFSDWHEANHLDNLICLCQPCHMKVEHGKISLKTDS